MIQHPTKMIASVRISTYQLKQSLRFLSTSAENSGKWPLVHPNRRRLQNLKSHLTRDKLLARPPSLALDKKHANIREPSRHDLKVVALHASIPFVGEFVIVLVTYFLESMQFTIIFISSSKRLWYHGQWNTHYCR